MRAARPFEPNPGSARLLGRRRRDRVELWTETVGVPPSVYGERWGNRGTQVIRAFEPNRSKLAAAIVEGWRGPLPRLGERWLYLGAASGSTASHVADLVGPSGTVYAVERSPRPFARLLAVATRWPNLLPILADARQPLAYADLVPAVDGLYADVAQPDQVEIVLANLDAFLRGPGSAAIVALKTASMGRDRPPSAHLAAAESLLASQIELARSVRLDPFHRGHYAVGGRAGRDRWGGEESVGRDSFAPDAKVRGHRTARPRSREPTTRER
jgi:fibrillarin-like rRNA methylase